MVSLILCGRRETGNVSLVNGPIGESFAGQEGKSRLPCAKSSRTSTPRHAQNPVRMPAKANPSPRWRQPVSGPRPLASLDPVEASPLYCGGRAWASRSRRSRFHYTMSIVLMHRDRKIERLHSFYFDFRLLYLLVF